MVRICLQCKTPGFDPWVQSLSQEDPLEKGKATHSSTLAWRIPWIEESGRLQSMGLQRDTTEWPTLSFHFHTCCRDPHAASHLLIFVGWLFPVINSLLKPGLPRTPLAFLNLTVIKKNPSPQSLTSSHSDSPFNIPHCTSATQYLPSSALTTYLSSDPLHWTWGGIY